MDTLEIEEVEIMAVTSLGTYRIDLDFGRDRLVLQCCSWCTLLLALTFVSKTATLSTTQHSLSTTQHSTSTIHLNPTTLHLSTTILHLYHNTPSLHHSIPFHHSSSSLSQYSFSSITLVIKVYLFGRY